MPELTRDDFLVLAKQAGLDPADPHLDQLYADVRTMFERLELMNAADVSGEPPAFTNPLPPTER